MTTNSSYGNWSSMTSKFQLIPIKKAITVQLKVHKRSSSPPSFKDKTGFNYFSLERRCVDSLISSKKLTKLLVHH